MNRLSSFVLFFVLLLAVQLSAQEVFTRASTIHTLTYEPGGGGFGGFVVGEDLDEDGIPDLYACNANYVDRLTGEMVPKIWKFEWNETTAAWDSVWGATLPDQAQNTWIGFTIADLDKDGKSEIIWCPSNYPDPPDPTLVNANPLRVIVYEVVGDGSDNLGVDDGFGAYLPNATTTIVPDDNFNLRPISLKVLDIDSDGTDELIFADQATDWHFGVLSVDDIPDNGSGLETWTIEANGVGDINLTDTGNKWDLAVVGNVIYLFAQSGIVYPVKYENQTWNSLPGQSGIGNGSFKGTAVADLDNDGIDEIIEGSWFTGGKVYVFKQVADTLQSFEVADLSTIGATRLNGAAVGDLDNDGKPDFVFGSRGDQGAPSVPNNSVYRVEFQGGDMTLPANYTSSIIDSFLVPEPDGLGGQLDVITIGNVDGDVDDEVVYTQGYTRGIINDTTADAAILDIQHTPVSVELADDNIPDQYYLDQNFPNPFNPSTTIKFGITEASNVDLRIYDAIGREVAVLISNQFMGAGSYNVKFDASNLASGNYVYRMTAGVNTVSRKMQILK